MGCCHVSNTSPGCREAALTRQYPYNTMIRQLIAEHRLLVHFQPIVDLRCGRVVGYEVLGRATGIDGIATGIDGPAALIERAHQERSLLALERAWRAAAVERIAAFPPLADTLFFLNVDVRLLEYPGFRPGFTRELLDQHGISPTRVVFELTEAGPVRDPAQLRALVRHYKSQGFLVALDDVGAGHATLKSLANVDPDVVKLDMALVQGVADDRNRRSLLGALACYCRQTRKTMVAEGLERWSDVHAVAQAGAQLGQGYLLGRPSPRPEPLDAVVETVLRSTPDCPTPVPAYRLHRSTEREPIC